MQAATGEYSRSHSIHCCVYAVFKHIIKHLIPCAFTLRVFFENQSSSFFSSKNYFQVSVTIQTVNIDYLAFSFPLHLLSFSSIKQKYVHFKVELVD